MKIISNKNSAKGYVVPGKDHVTMKFTKGHNSIKTVGGVKVLVLCTSSNNVLYMYLDLKKQSDQVCYSGLAAQNFWVFIVNTIT